MEDPTYVNPLISLLIIAWWLGVAFGVFMYLRYCGFFHFSPPRQRPQRPTPSSAPTCNDPEENS